MRASGPYFSIRLMYFSQPPHNNLPFLEHEALARKLDYGDVVSAHKLVSQVPFVVSYVKVS